MVAILISIWLVGGCDTQSSTSFAYHSYEDSVFNSQVSGQFEGFPLLEQEVEAISSLDVSQSLSLAIAERLFQREPVDWSEYKRFITGDSIHAEIEVLGVDSHGRQEVLVILGPTDGNSLVSDFVLIKGAEYKWFVIEQFHNYHHRHTQKWSFPNPANTTTFAYLENCGYGSGFWYFFWHFYTIDDLTVYPTLLFLSQSNVATGSGYRFLRYEGQTFSLSPLSVSVEVQNELLPTDSISPQYPFGQDSAIIRFEWDASQRTFSPMFPKNFSAMKYTSYISYDLDLFLDAYEEELILLELKGNDTVRNIIQRLRAF